MRTIRVTGKGQIRVRPDTTRVTLTLNGLYKDYGETLRRSSEDTEELAEVLAAFGFERSDLKTIRFGVNAEHESYQDRNGVFQQRFVGFRFHHVLKVEFGSDDDRLGRILYALADCRVDPQLCISYTVKDPEAVKNLLLGKAVADAKEKAAVLAQAGGIALREIQSIDYSWGQLDLEYRPMDGAVFAKNRMDGATAESYALNIQPDDLEVTDTVTVVWEIG